MVPSTVRPSRLRTAPAGRNFRPMCAPIKPLTASPQGRPVRQPGDANLSLKKFLAFRGKRHNHTFRSWVSEDPVIAKSSPTDRRVSNTLNVSDGGPLPRSTAVGLAAYASAPASIDRAAADVIGERFFGELHQNAPGTKSPRQLRANPSQEPGPQNPEALTRDFWSGCPDLNRGPLRPERSALTKLRHSPSASRRKQASHLSLLSPADFRRR